MKLVKFNDNAPRIISIPSCSGAPREFINRNYHHDYWNWVELGTAGTMAAGVFTKTGPVWAVEHQYRYVWWQDHWYQITTPTIGVGVCTLEGGPPDGTGTIDIGTKPLVYMIDVEYSFAREFLNFAMLADQDVSCGDLTDDRTDQFRGEITTVVDQVTPHPSVDGYTWYRIALSTTKRNISAITEDHPYWLTFENPYIMPFNLYTAGFVAPGPPYGSFSAPRYPAVWDQANPPGPDPYRDPTDPVLVDQPYDDPALHGGTTWEYAWPKCTRITTGISVEIDLPLYGMWARDAWVRPVDPVAGATAKVYVYCY